MKKILFLFSILVCSYALFSLAIFHLTDGFSTAKIHSDLIYSPQWEVNNPPRQEISAILNQKFYYIGKGSQCYVFESEDKQTILKFFRHSRYRLPTITQFVTCPAFLTKVQNQKKNAKHQKLNALFQSCQIAYNELHDETGLIYLHLNKKPFFNKEVMLYDKLKRVHTINIDDYEFLLQVHGEHIYPYLTSLIEKGKKGEAKEALFHLVILLANRLNKGIVDDDAVIHKNAGFRGNKAFFLDVGEFSKKRCKNLTSELLETTQHLREWLHNKDVELAYCMEKFIECYPSSFK